METSDTERRGLIGLHQIPNLICVLRVVFSFGGLAYMAVIHAEEGYWSIPSLVVIGLAALSDRLDGFLAKRYGWATPLGAVLDQISDKLVTLAMYCLIGHWGAFPLWGVALIVFREMYVTCLRISANLERIAIPTSQAGRFKTFTQQVAVLLIFMHWAWPEGVLAGQSLGQCVLWGGWLVFWVVMLGLGKKGFASFRRIYTVTRVDPRDGTEHDSHADLVLVWATIAAMAVPLSVGGPLTVLVITLGTGGSYWAAYLWARRVGSRQGGAGRRNIALSLVGSAVLSVGLVVALDRWPTLGVMWTLIGILSLLWAVLLTISYRTGLAASAEQAPGE